MSARRTAVERITLVVHPVWTYYRQQLCHSIPQKKSIQDNIASGKAQQMLDAFPHLSRAEAGFLARVADIIAGEDPLAAEEPVPQEQDQLGELIPDVQVREPRRSGFCDRVRQRMLAVLKKLRKRR